MILCCDYGSPLGWMVLAAEDSALIGVWFADQKHFGCGEDMVPGEDPVLSRTRDWLDRYYRGEAPDPEELPLSPRGTGFQRTVWDHLRQIPYGKTATYGELSTLLRQQGIRACAQAVGGAVGRNPISILIPCHRVVGSGGKMTGYDGGVEKKRFLLKLEGVV